MQKHTVITYSFDKTVQDYKTANPSVQKALDTYHDAKNLYSRKTSTKSYKNDTSTKLSTVFTTK